MLRETMPPVPFRDAAEIRAQAIAFLEEHHPSADPPVPIEEIVEFDLGIEIRPVRRLRHRYEIEGFLSADLSLIVVDEETMTRYSHRYRFTLAHEVGHRILHAPQIQWTLAGTPEEWTQRVKGIPPSDYSRMEAQANDFAGYLLVPTSALLTAYREAAEYATQRGIDLAGLTEESLTYVAEWIGKGFGVSGQVVSRRLRREGLIST